MTAAQAGQSQKNTHASVGTSASVGMPHSGQEIVAVKVSVMRKLEHPSGWYGVLGTRYGSRGAGQDRTGYSVPCTILHFALECDPAGRVLRALKVTSPLPVGEQGC